MRAVEFATTLRYIDFKVKKQKKQWKLKTP